MRRLLSAIRIARIAIRSMAIRAYLRLAFPNVSCHSTVRFGRGVSVRVFDGGQLEIGAGTTIQDCALIAVQFGRLSIGNGCLVGNGSVIVCHESVTIGDGTLIAEHVTIRDQDHRHEGEGRLDDNGLVAAPIIIGHDVWIGAKVTITRGVSIAPHSVIGANSVLTRSADQRGIYAAVPARLIRTT